MYKSWSIFEVYSTIKKCCAPEKYCGLSCCVVAEWGVGTSSLYLWHLVTSVGCQASGSNRVFPPFHNEIRQSLVVCLIDILCANVKCLSHSKDICRALKRWQIQRSLVQKPLVTLPKNTTQLQWSRPALEQNPCGSCLRVFNENSTHTYSAKGHLVKCIDYIQDYPFSIVGYACNTDSTLKIALLSYFNWKIRHWKACTYKWRTVRRVKNREEFGAEIKVMAIETYWLLTADEFTFEQLRAKI